MELAVEEARLAAGEAEVPVGAVAVLNGQLIARNHNRSIQLQDPTAHAEILVLREAASKLGNYRLNGLQLFVTVEPCAMCAGAAVWARIERLVFGAFDEKAGAVGSKLNVLQPGLLNHDVAVASGLLAEECRKPLRDFFSAKRNKAEISR